MTVFIPYPYMKTFDVVAKLRDLRTSQYKLHESIRLSNRKIPPHEKAKMLTTMMKHIDALGNAIEQLEVLDGVIRSVVDISVGTPVPDYDATKPFLWLSKRLEKF